MAGVSDSKGSSRWLVWGLLFAIGALIAIAPWFFNRSSVMALADCTAATLQQGPDRSLRAYGPSFDDDQIRRQALQKAGVWSATRFERCREQLCGALIDDGEGNPSVEVRMRDDLTTAPLAVLRLDPSDLDVVIGEASGCP